MSHYESTEQIFLEIVGAFSEQQKNDVFSGMEKHVPAVVILEERLSKYEREMNDRENSFSLAICEYYSDLAISKEDNAASVKVIQKNGGMYERSFSSENELADIYRIGL